MKSLLFCIVSAFCLTGIAEDGKPAEYRTLDMKQFEGLNTSPTKSNVQFAINCKTDDGRELKANDPGYTDCLSKSKNQLTK